MLGLRLVIGEVPSEAGNIILR